jgi:hypothetical protein
VTCEHRNRMLSKLLRFEMTGELRNVRMEKCHDCGEWLSLGKANDRRKSVRVEIAAARLIAGFETGNDTDDTLKDRICREVIEHALGNRDLRSRAAKQAHEIHRAFEETPS